MKHYSIHLENTSDGTHTIYVPEFDEHYHSVNGAVQESRFVFIDAGFRQFSKEKISVLEIGFGTGLNAYLTLLETLNCVKKITYTTLEYYPLDTEVIAKLNYPEHVSSENKHLYDKLHESVWEREIEIIPSFILKKKHTDIIKLNFLGTTEQFDLIYYDAFAPDKQPDMWQQSIFDYLYKHTNKDGILVTYCAKGIVRRMLQQAGYIVERLPGPPGKREMLRATKQD